MGDGALVVVVDANGNPISGATVAKAGGGTVGTTDANGTTTLPLAVSQPLELTVSQPNYVTEKVAFSSSVQSCSYNNSLVSRSVAADGSLSLTVTLGRCVAAPVADLGEAAIGQLAARSGDPGAALIFPSPRDKKVYAYRFQWCRGLRIQLAEEVLLPDSTPPDTAQGWNRFRSTTSDAVEIAERGRFFWLIYPQQPPSPQYAVAVWSPDISSLSPLDALDMVVFFSPTTAEYKGAYPFGLVPASTRRQGQVLPEGHVPEATQADQPYMTLGKKFILDEYCFAYQLAARRNPAVLVMPICAHGDWGPFASGSGMMRLLREVAVFLHRECRTSSLGVRQIGYDPAYGMAGASLRGPGRGIQAPDFGPVPDVGQVAVSFFSTGALPVKSLMNSGGWATPRAFPAQYWGALAPTAGGRDPTAAWAASWTELWDMDGFHPRTGGWYNYLTLLSQWYGTSRTRMFRFFHSSGRVPPDPLHDAHPFWKPLLKDGFTPPVTVASRPLFGSARELYGQRWSVVAVSDGYVAKGDLGIYPELVGDAHHNSAMVAFSHAATLTAVGARQPSSFQRGP